MEMESMDLPPHMQEMISVQNMYTPNATTGAKVNLQPIEERDTENKNSSRIHKVKPGLSVNVSRFKETSNLPGADLASPTKSKWSHLNTQTVYTGEGSPTKTKFGMSKAGFSKANWSKVTGASMFIGKRKRNTKRRIDRTLNKYFPEKAE
jgi:hypothetical protein